MWAVLCKALSTMSLALEVTDDEDLNLGSSGGDREKLEMGVRNTEEERTDKPWWLDG